MSIQQSSSVFWNEKETKKYSALQHNFLSLTEILASLKDPNTNLRESNFFALLHASSFYATMIKLLEIEKIEIFEFKTTSLLYFDESMKKVKKSLLSLNVIAKNKNIDIVKFDEIVKKAVKICPVSQMIDERITLDYQLSSIN